LRVMQAASAATRSSARPRRAVPLAAATILIRSCARPRRTGVASCSHAPSP
jgi:hypothetical protein